MHVLIFALGILGVLFIGCLVYTRISKKSGLICTVIGIIALLVITVLAVAEHNGHLATEACKPVSNSMICSARHALQFEVNPKSCSESDYITLQALRDEYPVRLTKLQEKVTVLDDLLVGLGLYDAQHTAQTVVIEPVDLPVDIETEGEVIQRLIDGKLYYAIGDYYFNKDNFYTALHIEEGERVHIKVKVPENAKRIEGCSYVTDIERITE